ncbi:MAG: hypothetical protein P8014_13790 [Acidihalobacter sp.]|uniref:hypothetical protein n=1 Tax=Acidihalobacter sp. TaxID=1872108 RepID=UPI00307E0886
MNQLNVETPIGTLLFQVTAGEGDIEKAHLSECTIEPIIPDGMSVEGCKAVLLRNTPITPLKDVVFSCTWHALKENGYGNSGEGLDAWEWEHNKTLVMIGTEDDEYLGSRVKLKETTSAYYPITMEGNSIKIHVSEHPANKELTLHFVISWNSVPEEVDSSCWFAVDIPHKGVLQECN